MALLENAFEGYDNLSVPFTYTLAYELAEWAVEQKDRPTAKYAKKAQEEGPLAYTYLYAYKYCIGTFAYGWTLIS